jgi:hypothetical protein
MHLPRTRSDQLKRSIGVLGVVVGFAVCLPLTEASGRHVEGVAVVPVAELALRASEVGPGYRAQVVPGGRQVKGRVTLDLCDFRYVSDSFRTSRIQLAYGHRQKQLVLSNEVVRYRGAGAELARQELTAAVARCPRTWRLTRLRDSRLLPISLAVDARISGTRDGKPVVGKILLVYQIERNVLSAVYAYGGTAAARRSFGLRAAALSANRLRRS